MPLRHGMTIGELARMFVGELKIPAKLEVVAMKGWQRGDWFDSTGLYWVNLSPNMRSLTEAILWHGGEAESAKERFRQMPPEDRAAVLAFLGSL